MSPAPLEVVNALYADFLERGIRYFFPEHRLEITGRVGQPQAVLRFHHHTGGGLDLEWCATRYTLAAHHGAFTENQIRLIGAIGHVLSARYRSIFVSAPAASNLHLFRGLPEDRFVSAFLDHLPYLHESGIPANSDIIADAIEVLRESSLITYENRRISTGVLLLGDAPGRLTPPTAPPGALAYTSELISIKSFHRLCDGIKTVFLVNRHGLLTDLIDLHEWTRDFSGTQLPAPAVARYRAHSLATLDGGGICLALTPNGEIKVFAEGAQVFNFLGGRWRLTEVAERYHRWHKGVGSGPLAERIFAAAINLAENRRGGLFVILDDPRSAAALIGPGDQLDHEVTRGAATPPTKDQIHYLLRDKLILDLQPAVLESVARMDGAIVMDRTGHLLAFGAILRNEASGLAAPFAEGGRTTAAMSASRFGHVLKVSEDGLVTFYRDGLPVWEI